MTPIPEHRRLLLGMRLAHAQQSFHFKKITEKLKINNFSLRAKFLQFLFRFAFKQTKQTNFVSGATFKMLNTFFVDGDFRVTGNIFLGLALQKQAALKLDILKLWSYNNFEQLGKC